MKYLLPLAALVLAGCLTDPKPTVHNITVECVADSVMVPDSLGDFSQRLCTYGDPRPPAPPK